jgi:hypothetical protein
MYGDHAFQLGGHEHQGGQYPWPPGVYPIAGIIKNYGVTYTEVDFNVNAQITDPYGNIIYDQTFTFTDTLTPGSTKEVAFPDVDIPYGCPNGNYKLTMKTLLNGDDHPNNDKEIFIFEIYYCEGMPPTTWAVVSGTMGEEDWYISNVTIKLEAIHGCYDVDYTMYKIDNGAWNEYEAPFTINSDGEHTVYFYSVDVHGGIEEVNSVSFRMDTHKPSITFSVEKIGFKQYKFVATVSDQTSGISYVRCYLDDLFLGDITEPGPYEWYWSGKGTHRVEGIAYDIAGNSAENIVTFSLSFDEPSHPFLSHALQLIMRFLERFPDSFPILRSLFYFLGP